MRIGSALRAAIAAGRSPGGKPANRGRRSTSRTSEAAIERYEERKKDNDWETRE